MKRPTENEVPARSGQAHDGIAAAGAQLASAEAAPPIVVSRFIPLTQQAVLADLCNDGPGGRDDEAFALMGVRLERRRSRGYDVLARRIRELYLPFTPDPDTVATRVYTAAERQAMVDELEKHIAHLLNRANYSVLSSAEIAAILSAQSPYALRIAVDLAEYDLMQVFIRDTSVKRWSVRRPERAYLLKAHFEVRVFRSLFVLLKLKSNDARALELAEAESLSFRKALRRIKRRRRTLPPDVNVDAIYVKVFKDMPQHDLQILFPLRTVQFRPFDKIKLMATAGGGTAMGIFTTTGKILAATNPLAAVGALIAFAGLAARQVTAFFNQRNQYMMELAQKLFFHNLANNRAAIALILDRAEEEDVKEDLIAMYFFGGTTIARAELGERKRTIDAMLAQRYRVAVDFEFTDALARLVGDGVVAQDGDSYRFMTFADAAAHYDVLLRSEDADEARHLAHLDASVPAAAAGAATTLPEPSALTAQDLSQRINEVTAVEA